MTERAWDLYRLSIAEQLPESAYKAAVIAGIKHRLHLLDQHVPSPDSGTAGGCGI
jgi:hypothetical protein